MNHFMLPGDGESDLLSGSTRYGAYAIEMLVNHLLKLGARRANLEAKVFGGARVMASLWHSQVGERNARFVLDFCRRNRYRLSLETCSTSIRDGRVELPGAPDASSSDAGGDDLHAH